jgi:glycosyltransferase involved in cell wall biosynthesis
VSAAAGILNSVVVAARHRSCVAAERQALTRARLVVCNSARTVEDVVNLVGVERARARRVYYGVDPARFSPSMDRSAARAALGYHDDRPVILFVGALGDRRKGFDTLFAAWRRLCGTADWDASLLVAGSGAELAAWKARAASSPEVSGRTRFLGYRDDVPALIAAADLLVHPARYEAYGLAVHEALCCAVPAIAPASAGVAERYTHDLRPLLLDDVNSADELMSRLRTWREARAAFRSHALSLGTMLRARTWDDMAHDIVALVEC